MGAGAGAAFGDGYGVVVVSARRPGGVVRGLGRAFLYLSLYIYLYGQARPTGRWRPLLRLGLGRVRPDPARQRLQGRHLLPQLLVLRLVRVRVRVGGWRWR
eukprot:scaffold57102_cov69-Phaeocystis_antarctica.AAC.2